MLTGTSTTKTLQKTLPQGNRKFVKGKEGCGKGEVGAKETQLPLKKIKNQKGGKRNSKTKKKEFTRNCEKIKNREKEKRKYIPRGGLISTGG